MVVGCREACPEPAWPSEADPDYVADVPDEEGAGQELRCWCDETTATCVFWVYRPAAPGVNGASCTHDEATVDLTSGVVDVGGVRWEGDDAEAVAQACEA